MAKQKRTKIDWKLDGFEEVRNAPKVREKVEEVAEKVKDIASEDGRVEGYVVAPRYLQEERAAVSVLAFGHANNHNFKHNALVKAMYQVKE